MESITLLQDANISLMKQTCNNIDAGVQQLARFYVCTWLYIGSINMKKYIFISSLKTERSSTVIS